MKTRSLLLSAAFLLAACGSSSDKGWKTDDLRYIPLFREATDMAFVDTGTGTAIGSYTSAGLFYDGMALVADADGCYYVDYKGERIGEGVYQDATIHDGGIAWAVKPGESINAIDKRGNVLFEFKQAETAFAFHNGLAVFADADGLRGVVDTKGKVVAEPQWSDAGPMFVNGLLPVKDEESGCWGVVDTKGEIVIDCRFDELATSDTKEGFVQNYVQALNEGRIPVSSGDKWGVVDRTGNFLINPQFDEILLDGKNYLFRKGGVWGWCDKEGQYLVNPQFRDALPFGAAEYAAVKTRNGEWGYIDRDGAWKIQPEYRDAGQFQTSGVAPVRDSDSREWGLIDKSGKWVVNPQFRGIYDIALGDRFMIQDQSRSFGLIDADGRYVVNPEYDNAPLSLMHNLSGIGVSYRVQSDFVDLPAIAGLIEAKLLSLKTASVGELLKTCGLKESDFPKAGGSVTLYHRNDTREVNFKITGPDIKAWNKASDGWFGYNYTFRPDIPVDSYVLTVKLEDRAWRFADAIFDLLTEKYPYDPEQQTLAVPDRQVHAFPVSDGGIVFHIKTR